MGILGSKLLKKSSKSPSKSATPSSLHSKLPSLAKYLPVASIPAFKPPTPRSITSHFPLLQLPSLAIYEVLKRMMPLELIQLSSVSKQTRKIVESLSKRRISRNNYKLKVYIYPRYDDLHINLYYGESKLLAVKFKTFYDLRSEDLEDSQLSEISIKFGDVRLPVKVNYNKNTITTYSNSLHTTFTTMLQYFFRTFNPILAVPFCDNKKCLVSKVIRLGKQENAKLDEFLISNSILNDSLYQKLLELPMRKLSILSRPSGYFCYKPSAEPMKFEELTICKAKWVKKLEIFLYCKSIHINETRVKERNFNKFLKKWMESNYPLEYAWISLSHYRSLNLRSIVEELSATPMNRACVNRIFCDFEDGKCYGLQRSNGENAIIYQLKDRCVIIQTESVNGSPFYNNY